MNVKDLPHYVYRYFGADDQVLYIGCTYDLTARHRQHRAKAPWFAEAVRRSHQTYPDRWNGLVAERVAIMVTRPLHNKTFNYWPLEDALSRELHGVLTTRPADLAERVADIEARALEDGKRRQHDRDEYRNRVDPELLAMYLRMGLTPQSAKYHARRQPA